MAGFTSREKLLLELRAMGIKDEQVLKAIFEVPREEFIPEKLKNFAYVNAPMAIGKEQTISQPYMVALMSELLEIHAGHKVLEIGTGSGYQAAILAYLGAAVYSVERILPLHESAKERLKRLDIKMNLYWQDGEKGLPEEAPFDRIVVTAACEEYPQFLEDQLNHQDGILIFPLGSQDSVQQLMRTCFVKGRKVQEAGIYCRFVPLKKGLTDL